MKTDLKQPVFNLGKKKKAFGMSNHLQMSFPEEPC